MKQILFVCIGNSIRSQMAEAFARKYGSDVIRAESVGLAPALVVDELTREVMAEVGISMNTHISKGTDFLFPGTVWDLVVNISGHPLPPELIDSPAIEWKIADPVGKSKELFLKTRDEIERLVMRLVLEIRHGGRVHGLSLVGGAVPTHDQPVSSAVSAPTTAAPRNDVARNEVPSRFEPPWHRTPAPAASAEQQPGSNQSLRDAQTAQKLRSASEPVAPPRTPAMQTRQSVPSWASLYAGNAPRPGEGKGTTSEGQPLSRGMRRALESGKKPQGQGGDSSGSR